MYVSLPPFSSNRKKCIHLFFFLLLSLSYVCIMNTDNKRGLSVPSLWPPLAGHSFDIRTIAKREGDRSPCQELETFHIGGVAVAAPMPATFVFPIAIHAATCHPSCHSFSKKEK